MKGYHPNCPLRQLPAFDLLHYRCHQRNLPVWAVVYAECWAEISQENWINAIAADVLGVIQYEDAILPV